MVVARCWCNTGVAIARDIYWRVWGRDMAFADDEGVAFEYP